MGLFNLTVNLAGLFNGCIVNNPNEDNPLELIQNVVEKETNNEIRISQILLKLVNGRFTSGMIYHIKNTNESIMIKKIGEYNFTIRNEFYTNTIPIYKNNELVFTILLISKERIKLDKTQLQLIKLLENNLVQ